MFGSVECGLVRHRTKQVPGLAFSLQRGYDFLIEKLMKVSIGTGMLNSHAHQVSFPVKVNILGY